MRVILLIVVFWCADPARGQMLADTLFSWQGYARESTCRIRVYRSAPKEERPFTVVIDELARNEGPSTLDDARHVVELVSRRFSIDPAVVNWIFHWGAFSYEGAAESTKELFFRATVRGSGNGSVGPPSWRNVTREQVVKLTDRAFR